ncbi:MAG: hypothetical protein RRY78_04115 [Clostridia bacterium]
MVYKKIAVIGCAGSGKSYFSKEISSILSIQCYHLDNLFWKPNWEETPNKQFAKIIDNLVNKSEWIIDGNYARTMKVRFAKADIVFFLDMPTQLCLESEKARRGIKRSDFPDYLEEKEDTEFLDWIKNFKNNDRNKIVALIKKYPNVKVVTFTSREQINNYLNELRNKTI